MHCYVLFVKNGREEDVETYLNEILSIKYSNRYQLYILRRKIIEYKSGEKKVVYHKLLPGYIFIMTNIIDEIYYQVISNKCSGIYYFLRNEIDFQEVQWYEIQTLFSLINEKGVIETSDIFLEKDKVHIIDGPLMNYSGHIKKINARKGRAKIEVNFLGNGCLFDISVNCIKELGDAVTKKSIQLR